MWIREKFAHLSRDGNWLALALGAVAAAAAQWAIVWVLARTGDQVVTGLYGFTLAWLTPIFAFCGLQLRPMLATETGASGVIRAYGAMRILGFAIALIAVALVALIQPVHKGVSFILIAASIPRFAEMIADYAYGMRTRHSAFALVGISQAVRAACSVVAFALVWFTTDNLSAALFATGAAAFAAVYRMDRRALNNASEDLRHLSPDTEERAHLSFTAKISSLVRTAVQMPSIFEGWASSIRATIGRQEREVLSRLLRVALPLALIAFLNQTIASVPRLLMGKHALLVDLAVFTCLMSLLALPSLMATAYASGLSPQFADAYGRGGVSRLCGLVHRSAWHVMLVAFGATLGLVAGGNVFMQLIYGSQYSTGIDTLVGIGGFATAWSVSAVYGTASTAARKIAPQAIGFSLSLVACSLSGWWWIPKWGVSGAAWSMCVAGLVLVATYWVSFRILHYRAVCREAERMSRTEVFVRSPLPEGHCRPNSNANPSSFDRQGGDVHVSQAS